MAENAKDRIVRYLADAHASEIGSLHALNDIAAETNNDAVRMAIQEHATQTQSQADRLEARLNALGAKSNSVKAAVNTIIGKGSDLLNAFHDQEDKQTQDVIKAYALENFVVAFYTAMHTYAAGVGDHETAQLAKMILGEEQLAGERLLRLIPQLAQQAVAKTEGATVAA
jgi:ferritin-like metal-binding protein YciE